ncbi:SPFH domain-containing protein [Streptomyces sp. NPDC059752]|uniref:SPFH domain-containing protein n=1 Tax=unclassified Streptomyces TaxID=2593676 RepID=UPI00366535EF
MSSVVVAVVGVVVLLALLALVVVTRYKVAGPSEAFLITGRRGKKSTDPATGQVFTDTSGQKVVVGGGVFVVPFVQQRYTLDLSSRHIPVAVRGAVTLRGIKAHLEGVAIVKVGGNEDAIRAAAQRFLQQQDGIVGFTQEVLSGALRAIVGRMSVEDIIRDRAAFAKGAAEAEAMQKKADAFESYGDAAMVQMLVEVLPQVVAKAAEPLSAIDKMTVISTDGANKLSRTVAENVAQGMELLGSTTGVDLARLLKGLNATATVTEPATPAGSVPANGKIAITD